MYNKIQTLDFLKNFAFTTAAIACHVTHCIWCLMNVIQQKNGSIYILELSFSEQFLRRLVFNLHLSSNSISLTRILLR